MGSIAVVDGLVVSPHGRSRQTIVAEDGVITACLRPSDRPAADVVIDAGGAPVIPGVIDPHVHLGLSQSFADACHDESRAAVTGGVTAMWHYLISPSSFSSVYAEHANAVRQQSLVDMGFHGLVTNDTQITETASTVDRLGITSFKFHMAMKGPEAAYGIRGVDDGAILDGFRAVAAVPGVLALVHTENIDVILRHRDRLMAENPDPPTSLWTEYRPAYAEEEAMVRAFRWAELAGAPMGVVHNSVGAGPDLLASARASYPRLYMETCPQYLVLDKDMDLGSWGKVNPPLRSRADQEKLWRALASGRIDWMGSDHCDYDLASRAGPFWEVGPGLPSGMPMILPVLLSEGVNKGRLSLERLVALTSTTWARISGHSPRKGVIGVGSDADMVVLDMDRSVRITADVLNSYSDYTPYEGMVMTGWPRATIVRGNLVYDRGELDGQAAHRGQVLVQDRSSTPEI